MFGQEKRVVLAARPALPETEYHDIVANALTDRRALLDEALAKLATRADAVAGAAGRLVETLQTGHRVFIAGNGGSAAEAQHFAAELVGRFKRERAPYAVLALTTDTSVLTAVANDYGYADVFARQVRAFGQPDDLLITFSTSGESENLVRAAQAAREHMLTVVSITGDRHNRLERLSNVSIRVPALATDIIQELHLTVLHMLCDIVEQKLSVADWKGDAGQ